MGGKYEFPNKQPLRIYEKAIKRFMFHLLYIGF